jgi:4-amino-4-deoxy-L-arabinose transferase-like glycosyltransferase
MLSPKHTAIERCFWILLAGVSIFFAKWSVQGLQPDAALYAGLSYKAMHAINPWALEGTRHFQNFFEHPPFFFVWGAEVLRYLGTSDGAARAIGGIFGYLSFVLLGVWLWLRFSWSVAVLALFFVATTGHYTKFAATAMLEAPLSFAVMLAWMATWELHWKKHSGLWRPLWCMVLYFALFLAVASKGLAGFGAWGGLVLSLFLAFFFSERSPRRIVISFFTLSIAFLFCLIPFGIWFWKTYQNSGPDLLIEYFLNQVVRSATTNRGESSIHPASGDLFYYVKVLVRYGWPWWWLFVFGWLAPVLAGIFASRVAFFQKFREHPFCGFAYNSLAFSLSFILPFSLVNFQLSHYLHPIYLLSLPLAAFVALFALKESVFLKIFEGAGFRWSLLIIAAVFLFSGKTSKTHENRGQIFVHVASQLNSLPSECVVLVREEEMDSYRMESYSLWYWRGRVWDFTIQAYPSSLAVPAGKVYWSPRTGSLLGQGHCSVSGQL